MSQVNADVLADNAPNAGVLGTNSRFVSAEEVSASRPTSIRHASQADHEALVGALPKASDGSPARFPDPLSTDWAFYVNDGGPEVPGRANNCADLGLSVLSTWFGQPTAAGSRTEPSGAETGSTARQERVLGSSYRRMPGGDAAAQFDALRGQLLDGGPGAAAVIITTGRQPDAPTSHTWNAVNHGGTIVWLDAQTGLVSPTAPIHTAGITGVWAIVLDADARPIAGNADPGHPQDSPPVKETEGTRRSTTEQVSAPEAVVPPAANTDVGSGEALPGFYRDHHDLLYNLERIDGLDKLADEISDAVPSAFTTLLAKKGGAARDPQFVPGELRAPNFRDVIKNEWRSLFASGGRSFDAEYLGGQFEIHIEAKPEYGKAKDVRDSGESSKFDTRVDASSNEKSAASDSQGGQLTARFVDPATHGVMGGGAITLSNRRFAVGQPTSTEHGSKQADMRTLRSGKNSKLVTLSSNFQVTVSDARSLSPRLTGDPVTAAADVVFHTFEDIERATKTEQEPVKSDPREGIRLQKYTADFFEYFTAERVVGAHIDDKATTWNEVVEHTLHKLREKNLVDHGSEGAETLRQELSQARLESNVTRLLGGGTETAPIARNKKFLKWSLPEIFGSRGVILQMTAEPIAVEAVGAAGKTTIRWQPATSSYDKTGQSYKTGVDASVYVGPGFEQSTIAAASFQVNGQAGMNMTKAVTQTRTSVDRLGYELKDVDNVQAKTTLRLTIKSTSGLETPIVVDVDVIGRLPSKTFDAIAAGAENDKNRHEHELAKTGWESKSTAGETQSAIAEKFERAAESALGEATAAQQEAESAQKDVDAARWNHTVALNQEAAARRELAHAKSEVPDGGTESVEPEAAKNLAEARKRVDDRQNEYQAAESQLALVAEKARVAHEKYSQLQSSAQKERSAADDARREADSAEHEFATAMEKLEESQRKLDATERAADPEKNLTVPEFAKDGGRYAVQNLTEFQGVFDDVKFAIGKLEGDFLPVFDGSGEPKPESLRDLGIRQRNLEKLNGILSPFSLRQNMSALLGKGMTANISRPGTWGPKNVIVHVRAEFVDGFRSDGTETNYAVRTSQTRAVQYKYTRSRQFSAGLSASAGGVRRRSGSAGLRQSAGGSAGAGYRYQRTDLSGSQITGSEMLLNGGTKNSEAFSNNLKISVTVTPQRVTPRFANKSVSRLVRSIEFRDGIPEARKSYVKDTAVIFIDSRGNKATQYEFEAEYPVVALFDQASVMTSASAKEENDAGTEAPPVVSDVEKSRLSLGKLDQPDEPGLTNFKWLEVSSFPGAKRISDAAESVLRKFTSDQDNARRLDGLRRADAIKPGMPLWEALQSRLGEAEQRGALRDMIDGKWIIDNVAGASKGAKINLAVKARLRNPTVVPVDRQMISTESASIGGHEVDSVRISDHRFGIFGGPSGAHRQVPDRRSSGQVGEGGVENTPGGGTIAFASNTYTLDGNVGTKKGESLAGTIERNSNNRSGTTASYLVSFDADVSIGAEMMFNHRIYSLFPHSLRPQSHRSVTERSTIREAVQLRLSYDQLLELQKDLNSNQHGDEKNPDSDQHGNKKVLVQRLAGDSDDSGGLLPTPKHSVTLDLDADAANSKSKVGQGIFVVHHVDPIHEKMFKRPAGQPPAGHPLARRLKSIIDNPHFNDNMHQRQILRDLLSAEGLTQHLTAITDGGISLFQLEPRLLEGTFGYSDVRLVAVSDGNPKLLGLVANNDDIDVKVTYAKEEGGGKHSGSSQGGRLAATGAGFFGNTGAENGSTARDGGRGDSAPGGVSSKYVDVGAGGGLGSGVSRVQNTSRDNGNSDFVTQVSSARGVKARVESTLTYQIQAIKSKSNEKVVLFQTSGRLVQDRWADDLLITEGASDSGPSGDAGPVVSPEGSPASGVDSTAGKQPTSEYVISAEDSGTILQTDRGLPVPARFVPEGISDVAEIQDQAVDRAAALRLGMFDVEQLRQALGAEKLLPAVAQMLAPGGFALPKMRATGLIGSSGSDFKVKLVPKKVRLGGVSSKVYREYAAGQGSGLSGNTGTSWQSDSEVPLYVGEGNPANSRDHLPAGFLGLGFTASSTEAAMGSGTAGASSTNTKPESPSALLHYECDVKIEGSLGGIWKTPVEVPHTTTISLRADLDVAEKILGVGSANMASTGDAARVADFQTIKTGEIALAKQAAAFVAAAEELKKARHSLKLKEGSISDLVAKRAEAGAGWLRLAAEQGERLKMFRRYQGVLSTGSPDRPVSNPDRIDQGSELPPSTTGAASTFERASGFESGNLTRPSSADQSALENAVPRDESGTPLRHQDPRLGTWNKLVNDGGPTVFGRANNCADTALSFVSTWFGQPAVSGARTAEVSGEKDSTRRQEQTLGGTFRINPGSTAVEMFGSLADELRAAGHGAAAVIITAGKQPSGSSGHSWNAVNHQGEILWVDAQNRIAASDVPIHTEGVTAVWSIVLGPSGHPIGAGWSGTEDTTVPPAGESPAETTEEPATKSPAMARAEDERREAGSVAFPPDGDDDGGYEL
nr:hypothetical protein Ade03nite_91600 [Actinoplanes derwentensis]